MLKSEDQIDPLLSHPQQKIGPRKRPNNRMKGNKGNNRHTHWLSVDSQAGSSPRSSWSCCTWNTFCLVQQVSAVRLLTTPGLRSWAPCSRHPGENAFSSLHVFFAHPCCSAQGEMLTLSGWGRKLLPGVERGESALFWISTVIIHVSKLSFIVNQNNSN